MEVNDLKHMTLWSILVGARLFRRLGRFDQGRIKGNCPLDKSSKLTTEQEVQD